MNSLTQIAASSSAIEVRNRSRRRHWRSTEAPAYATTKQLGDSARCQDICEDAVARVRAEQQARHTASVRLARCTEGTCEVVMEVDSQCYGVTWVSGSVAHDCSLSHDELLAAPRLPAEPFGGFCDGAAAQSCESATDCTGGQACNGAACGPCDADRACQGETIEELEQCLERLAGFSCLSGEVCVFGVCVPESQALCVTGSECPASDVYPPEACRLSGVDRGRTRGNEQTWSTCASSDRACWGIQLPDTLTLSVGAPEAAAPTEPLPSPEFGSALAIAEPACGEAFDGDGFDLAPGAELELSVVGQLQQGGDCLGNLTEVTAGVTFPENPGVSPDLWFDGGRGPAMQFPTNWDREVLVTTSRRAFVNGCEGRWGLVVEYRGAAPRDASAAPELPLPGTPLLLHRRFQADDRRTLACTALLGSAGACTDLFQVQIGRP